MGFFVFTYCLELGVIEVFVCFLLLEPLLIDPSEIFFFFFSGVTLILIITEKLYKMRILVWDGYDKVRPPP